jgi:hypothetical protein
VREGGRGHLAAHRLQLGADRLEVHRLPDRAGLDVGGVERRDQSIAAPEPLSADRGEQVGQR